MSKLVNIKTDGALKISVESRLLESTRKAHAWYTSKQFGTYALLILAVIDIGGFLQIADLTLKASPVNKMIIVSAFAVAFEVAPLYIGYALCLKSYNLGKPIHNWVLAFSTISSCLGVIGNIAFRILTMDIAYFEPTLKTTSSLALPMTVLMCILPVITSLVNLVIGCLSFDPLLFDILRLSKKLRMLRLRKRQLEAYYQELTNNEDVRKTLLEDENKYYNNAKMEFVTMRTRLRNYITARVLSTRTDV